MGKEIFRSQLKSSFLKCHHCSQFPSSLLIFVWVYTFYIVHIRTPCIFFCLWVRMFCHGLQGVNLKSVSQASDNCSHSVNNHTWQLNLTKLEEWSSDIWKCELAHRKSSSVASRRNNCLFVRSVGLWKPRIYCFGEDKCILSQIKYLIEKKKLGVTCSQGCLCFKVILLINYLSFSFKLWQPIVGNLVFIAHILMSNI